MGVVSYVSHGTLLQNSLTDVGEVQGTYFLSLSPTLPFPVSDKEHNTSQYDKEVTNFHRPRPPVVGVSRTLVTSGGGGRVQPACSCLPLPSWPPALVEFVSPLHPNGTMIISRGAARLLPPVEGCTLKEMHVAAHSVNTRVRKKNIHIFTVFHRPG